MTTTHRTLIVGLLALLIGLLGGYFFGTQSYGYRMPHDGVPSGGYGHMMDDFNDDERIVGDGAMQHAMEEMMLGFRGKTGEAYEEAFLRGMIVHHLGAIHMAEELLEQTDRPELVNMANDIISTQSAEVETMERWLNEWYQ